MDRPLTVIAERQRDQQLHDENYLNFEQNDLD
jgi:hypothetical protein